MLCLRDFHDDVDEAKGTKLRLVRIGFNAWHVDEAEAQQALRVLLDPAGSWFWCAASTAPTGPAS